MPLSTNPENISRALQLVSLTMSQPAASRGLGAMLGAATGDALGTTLEFQRVGAKPWSPLLSGPHTEVVGAGPFRLVAGQVTDDTHMACCIAASLHAHNGRFDAEDVAARYLAWSEVTFDIGGQTGGSLGNFRRSGDAARCGIEQWLSSGKRGAGNGSLMRCTPIAALVGVERGEQQTAPADSADTQPNELAALRRDAALTDSLITHADPRCLMACAAYVAAIGAAIDAAMGAPAVEAGSLAASAPTGTDGPSSTRDGVASLMLTAARAELPVAARETERRLAGTGADVTAALLELQEDLRLAAMQDPELDKDMAVDGRAQGYVRVAFRLAFWELLHAPTYEAGLIDAVNRAGDADTNGAIVGGLLGARDGLSALPLRWLEPVLDCQLPETFSNALHPRTLVAAASGLYGLPA